MQRPDFLETALRWATSRTNDAPELSDLSNGDSGHNAVLLTKSVDTLQSWGRAAELLQSGGRLISIVSLLDHSLPPLAELQQHFVFEESTAIGPYLGLVARKHTAPTAVGGGSLPLSIVEDIIRASDASLRASQLNERTLTKGLRKTQADLRKRTAQFLESTQNSGEDDLEKQRLKDQLRKAEATIDQVKRTLSFRLGYELIHRSKSLRGLASLPAALWEVNQEATRRRDGKPLFPVLDKIRKRSSQGSRRTTITSASKASHHPGTHTRSERSFALPKELNSLATGKELRSLRLAAIMDEFTLTSFEAECSIQELSTDKWQQELVEFRPHLVFVESAWRGKDDSWQGKIGHVSHELRAILSWCEESGIPTAFWCKEDPVHYSTFINTAGLFDFVFTTDIDCIHRYKETLGHHRVYLLPFACQPASQNPIEKYDRKDAACFAGAYYVRYPERQRDFLRMVLKLLEHRPVEIFDRNYGASDPGYQFPKSYVPLIQGKLAFSEIDRAYKGYNYAININSIKYSQSMFARRVFEVLASNTVTVSNFSRGMQLFFGDLVITTDDATTLENRLEELSDALRQEKFRLEGLRKVLSEHTYQDRLAYVVSKVFQTEIPRLLPNITVLASVDSEIEAAGILDACARQRLAPSQIVILAPQSVCSRFSTGPRNAEFVAYEGNGSDRISTKCKGADYVACLSTADYYGPTYLLDLALASRYLDVPVIGKFAHYRWRSGEERPTRINPGCEYQPTNAILARGSIAKASCFDDATVEQFREQIASFEIRTPGFSIDPYSYCQEGAAHSRDSALSEINGELPGLDRGFPLERILREAESIVPPPPIEDDNQAIESEGLRQLFPAGDYKALTVRHDGEGMVIESILEPRTSQYLYSDELCPIDEFGFRKEARFFLDVSSGIPVQTVFIFFDENKKRLTHTINPSLTNHVVEVPADTAYVRFGIHSSGPGRVVIRRLVLGLIQGADPVRIFGKSKVLLVTNNYPSSEFLYRNAFVHRRVLGYKERGLQVDVFRFGKGQLLSYHDFEGVPVISGGAETLSRLIETNEYETVAVHFLDQSIWSVLRESLSAHKTIVWVHGADISSWQRRKHNHSNEEQKRRAIQQSKEREVLWNDVANNLKHDLRLVFVSQCLADEAQQDLNLSLPSSGFEIIHNPIDGELFSYEAKDPEQRKRILLIRPFASRTYANDLAVEAILALSAKPFFEELEFRIIGDGPLFEETLARLRELANVQIEQGFVAQTEIAELHKDYGVFLVPTRADSQGVSRDEAMASGLVPITNAVSAVPEFADDDCAILAPPEDANALAEAIEKLYSDPALFLRLSANAAARVRRQSGTEQTIARELALLLSDENLS